MIDLKLNKLMYVPLQDFPFSEILFDDRKVVNIRLTNHNDRKTKDLSKQTYARYSYCVSVYLQNEDGSEDLVEEILVAAMQEGAMHLQSAWDRRTIVHNLTKATAQYIYDQIAYLTWELIGLEQKKEVHIIDEIPGNR